MSLSINVHAQGPLHVDTFSFNKALTTYYMFVNNPNTSNTLGTADRIFYNPVYLPFRWNAKRMFHVNGSTSNGATVNLGIYSSSGSKIVETGNFTRSGTNVVQYTDITDVGGGPGLYYFAIVNSSATVANYYRTTSYNGGPFGSLYETTTSQALPSTMNPAGAETRIVWMGFTQSSTL